MFAQFYDAWFDLMYAEAEKLTGWDEQRCLDLVQDSMLKAIRSMKPIDSENRLRAFIKTIVRSVVYDTFRQVTARRRREQQYRELTQQERSENIESEARLAWIEEQVGLLDPELRSIFDFRYRLGWSLKTIGQKIGLGTGAVDGRIRRALEEMKRNARETYDEP